MSIYVLVLHISICLILIGLILLQSGKEGMGVVFGGGSNSLFGAGGAGSFLVRLTAIIATIFLMTSLGYNYLNKTKVAYESSVMDIPLSQPVSTIEGQKTEATQAAPASAPNQIEQK